MGTSIPGIRGRNLPALQDSPRIPFSKAAPRDYKQELRKYYGAAGQVIGHAKAGEVQLQIGNSGDRPNVLKDGAMYRYEREMNLAHFRDLMRIFKHSATSPTAKLTLPEFKSAFSVVLGQELTEDQMTALFMKVDANMDEAIDWDEFSTFMLLRAQGQTTMMEQAEMRLLEPDPRISRGKGREEVVRIWWVDKWARIVSCARDGGVGFWTEGGKLSRWGWCGKDCDKDAVLTPHTNPSSKTQRWVHDFVPLPMLNKLALATDDHMITFYDATTLDTTHTMHLPSTIPLSIDFHPSTNPLIPDILLYGTDTGQVTVLPMPTLPTAHTVQPLSLPKPLFRKNIHGDWVSQVRYLEDLRAVVSVSHDENESIVLLPFLTNGAIGRSTSVGVRKGCSCFEFLRSPLALVTGGADRQLRIWDPHHLQRPSAVLPGHNAPIVSMSVNIVHAQVISLSVDQAMKVWDIRKQQCLQSLAAPSVTVLYSLPSKVVAATPASMLLHNYQEPPSNACNVKSHPAAVRGALWNDLFDAVVSGCDGGVVHVWDVMTGQKTFRFENAHGKTEITAMTFDAGKRRLITGGRDGTIHIFNFNNGQLLQTLLKYDTSEVTGIIYTTHRALPHILTTGWNRLLSIFADNVGTDAGEVFPTAQYPTYHSDDVLCIACWRGTVVTGSWNGEVVWRELCPSPTGGVLAAATVGGSIDRVIFVRAHNDTVILLSCGGEGILRIWDATRYEVSWEVDAAKNEGDGVAAICTNSPAIDGDQSGRIQVKAPLIMSGDSSGWIRIWALEADTTLTPIKTFRGHLRGISSVDYVNLAGIDGVVSGGVDCTVRLFTVFGDFIGTFGQPDPWDVTVTHTYLRSGKKPADVAMADRELEEQVIQDEADEHFGEVSRKSITASLQGRSAHTPPKTADLLRNPYPPTAFASSLYARQVLRKPLHHHYNRRAVLPPIHGAGPGGIFHQLEPFPLADVNTILPPIEVIKR
ncbi:WD40 repeat domain 95 [Gaertneriomyces sp. JEL0708]|nr:WD40 repeat domain 95 [Gaertneriomyces sp. JEL0708]